MAIIELQIRTPRFLDFLRNRINRARLPFATWPSTGVLSLMEGLQELKGGLLQQIECTRAALVPGSESVPINIELMFRYNSLYATIKNAGSLNAPVMEAVGQNFELALSLRLE